MTILKDPQNDLPEEIVEFNEVYSDINTPEIWISGTKEDLTPKLIVLDGHSTLIAYTQNAEDLKWEAYNDIGQYSYLPDEIGDGLISFPHTFYFEFSVELSEQNITVSANFDGSNIKAIVMPMKEVTISEFIDLFRERLSSVFTSVLKPNDTDFSIAKGETLHIPDSILSKLSLKLALMGINLSNVKILDIVEKTTVSTDEIVEGTFEPPEEGASAKADLSLAKSKKKKKAKKDEKPLKVPPASPKPAAKVPPKVPSTPPATPPSPGGAVPPPPPVASASKGGAGGPPPATPTAKSAPPAAPPATPKAKSAPSASPRPAPKKAVKMEDLAPPMTSKERSRGRSRSISEESMDDMLMAKGMGEPESLDLRHTHATWFERMNPARSYPLIIKISTSEMRAKKSVTNVMSGEKLSEQEGTMMVKTDDTLVDIIPQFAGCIVVPNMVSVDITKPEVTARFHVTPLAMGYIDARVVFQQGHDIIHSMDLETKVIQHQLSKWMAIGGTIVGFLPAVLAFATGKTPTALFNEGYAALGLSALAQLKYWLPGGIFAISAGIAAGLRYVQRPIQKQRSVSFSQ